MYIDIRYIRIYKMIFFAYYITLTCLETPIESWFGDGCPHCKVPQRGRDSHRNSRVLLLVNAHVVDVVALAWTFTDELGSGKFPSKHPNI